MAADRLATVVKRIEGFIAGGEIAGAALAVAVAGEQVVEWYGGEAAPERPAGPETRWPLASISKLYTATAVMALVEEGLLTLATPVRELLPEFAGDERDAVRLRHLLTHTSGLTDNPPDLEGLLIRQTPLETMLAEGYRQPLRFSPGTGFFYSDVGYGLAGRMAAVAAGTPFGDVIRTRVAEPGGLRHTFMPTPPEERGRVAYVRASFAEGTAGALYNSPYAQALEHGALAAVASVNDLLRFGLLFSPDGKERILSQATIRTMTTDQTGGHVTGSPDDPDVGILQAWGAGFHIRGGGYGSGDLLPPGSYGHGGATGCALWIDPVDRLVIAYVSNTSSRVNRVRHRFRIDSVLNGVVAALT